MYGMLKMEMQIDVWRKEKGTILTQCFAYSVAVFLESTGSLEKDNGMGDIIEVHSRASGIVARYRRAT